MSEVQLKRILAQNERIREDVETSKNIVKVSDSCGVLLDYVKNHPDPFLPNWDHAASPNEWQSAGSGAPKCSLL